MRSDEPTGGTRAWIQSPAYDLTFFLLAPLAGMAYLGAVAAGASTVALVGATLIGIPHYLSTFTFYFWEENRARHRARWIAFYAGPAILAVVYFAAVEAGAYLTIQLVTYFWNAFHVSRQSCGFVSIYRHRAGVSEPVHKRRANLAILATNASFVFYGLEFHAPVRGLFESVHPEAPRLLFYGATALAAFALVRLAVTFVRRRRAGDGPRGPELGALATALLLFHPYLWFADSERATLALLLGHFLQYLGIVWLVHRRRFGASADSGGSPSWLRRLSASVPLLVVVCGLSGVLFLSARLVSRHLEVEGSFNVLFILLTYTHFYLDGLFWSFRDPHVRRTLGPVLAGAPRAPRAPRAGGVP